MMGEPVEQGAGEPFGAEYGSPFIERQVAGDQRGATFIALAERLEEQFGADSRERHIAQLVDDQQLDCVEVLLQPRRRRSSRASMSSCTRAAAVVKATLNPFWQAANPNPKAVCVLPVPDETAP